MEHVDDFISLFVACWVLPQKKKIKKKMMMTKRRIYSEL